MATFKSISYKTTGFADTIGYIMKEDRKNLQSALFVHNMDVINSELDEIEAAFRKNDEYRKQRKNGNTYYHESINFHPKDSAYIKEHPEMLEEFARVYLELRAPGSVAIAKPHFDKEHIHVHFMISANEKESNRTVRLSQKQFETVKRTMDLYQKEYHPGLQYSYVRTGKEQERITTTMPVLTKQEEHIKAKEEGKRLDKEELRELVLAKVQEVKDVDQNLEQLEQALTEQGVEMYTYRGKANGIIHEGKKYRFSTLLGRQHVGTKMIDLWDTEHRERIKDHPSQQEPPVVQEELLEETIAAKIQNPQPEASPEQPVVPQEPLLQKQVVVKEGEIIGVEEEQEQIVPQAIPEQVEEATTKRAVKEAKQDNWRIAQDRNVFDARDQEWIINPKKTRKASYTRSERDFVFDMVAKQMNKHITQEEFGWELDKQGITLVSGKERYGVPIVMYKGNVYACSLADRFKDRTGDMRYKWEFWKQPLEEQATQLEQEVQERREFRLQYKHHVFGDVLSAIRDAEDEASFASRLQKHGISVVKSEDGAEIIGVEAVGKQYTLASFFNPKDSFDEFHLDKVASWSMNEEELAEREQRQAAEKAAFDKEILHNELYLSKVVRHAFRKATSEQELTELLGEKQLQLYKKEDGKTIAGIIADGEQHKLKEYISSWSNDDWTQDALKKVNLWALPEEEQTIWREQEAERTRKILLSSNSYVTDLVKDAVRSSETEEQALEQLNEEGIMLIKKNGVITGVENEYTSFTLNSLVRKDTNAEHFYEKLYQWSLPEEQREQRREEVEEQFRVDLLHNEFYLGSKVINGIANSRTQKQWFERLKEANIEVARNEKTKEIEGVIADGKTYSLHSFIRPEREYLLDRVKQWDQQEADKRLVELIDEGEVDIVRNEKTKEVEGVMADGKMHPILDLNIPELEQVLEQVDQQEPDEEQEEKKLLVQEQEAIADTPEQSQEEREQKRQEEQQIEIDTKHNAILEKMRIHKELELDVFDTFWRTDLEAYSSKEPDLTEEQETEQQKYVSTKEYEEEQQEQPYQSTPQEVSEAPLAEEKILDEPELDITNDQEEGRGAAEAYSDNQTSMSEAKYEMDDIRELVEPPAVSINGKQETEPTKGLYEEISLEQTDTPQQYAVEDRSDPMDRAKEVFTNTQGSEVLQITESDTTDSSREALLDENTQESIDDKALSNDEEQRYEQEGIEELESEREKEGRDRFLDEGLTMVPENELSVALEEQDHETSFQEMGIEIEEEFFSEPEHTLAEESVPILDEGDTLKEGVQEQELPDVEVELDTSIGKEKVSEKLESPLIREAESTTSEMDIVVESGGNEQERESGYGLEI